MNAPHIYIVLTLLVLAAIELLLVFSDKRKFRRLTPLAGIAFGFIIAGVAFANQGRLITYSLMGVGVCLSIIDIIRKSRAKVQ